MKTPEQKLREIEEYCAPYAHYMWAATIIGIVLGADFRDVPIQKTAMEADSSPNSSTDGENE